MSQVMHKIGESLHLVHHKEDDEECHQITRTKGFHLTHEEGEDECHKSRMKDIRDKLNDKMLPVLGAYHPFSQKKKTTGQEEEAEQDESEQGSSDEENEEGDGEGLFGEEVHSIIDLSSITEALGEFGSGLGEAVMAGVESGFDAILSGLGNF